MLDFAYNCSVLFTLRTTIVLNSVVNLQITVTDVNDNPPVFSPPMFITSVLEIIPIGASIFEVGTIAIRENTLS